MRSGIAFTEIAAYWKWNKFKNWWRAASFNPPGSPIILLVALGPQNLDLALGLDLSVAFVETTRMSHVFRVLETASLRIKRVGAIGGIPWKAEP